MDTSCTRFILLQQNAKIRIFNVVIRLLWDTWCGIFKYDYASISIRLLFSL